MQTFLVTLLLMLALGLLTRKYNARIRLLLSVIIVGMLLYIYIR